MQPAPEPINETARLAALRELRVLDTLPEEAFDRITRLAATLLNVPIAVISLVDRDRQWFKSNFGLDAKETSREVAFCSHAILEDRVMVVRDATADSRFVGNPLVDGDPGIRFYAGAPLKLSMGIHLGTLCGIDREPRDITAEQKQALTDLAAIVVDELRLRELVDAQVEVNRELEKKSMGLKLANESLEQFAYMASHDLRAPLNTIVNMIDIELEERDGVPSEQMKFIRASAHKLDAMVNGYRRLAKLECGEKSSTCLNDLLEEAGAQVGDVATTSTPTEKLYGDRQLLTQVLANLITNAQVHGSGSKLAVDVTNAGEWSRLRCSNKVTEEIAANRELFAPFRKGRQKSDGLGLGLTIVDRVAQLHGGSVSASSTGESFCVDLKIPRGSS